MRNTSAFSQPLQRYFIAPSVWTWCLFCRMTAFTMANEKPKPRKQSRLRTMIRLTWKWWQMVQFKKQTTLSEPMRANCKWQGLMFKQNNLWFDGTPISEMDTSAQVQVEGKALIGAFQQQVSINRGLLLYSQVVIQTKNTFSIRKQKFGPNTSCPLQYRSLFFGFPTPFLYCTEITGVNSREVSLQVKHFI